MYEEALTRCTYTTASLFVVSPSFSLRCQLAEEAFFVKKHIPLQAKEKQFENESLVLSQHSVCLSLFSASSSLFKRSLFSVLSFRCLFLKCLLPSTERPLIRTETDEDRVAGRRRRERKDGGRPESSFRERDRHRS